MTAHELPAVEIASKTDPGRDPDKQVNEDACGCRETRFGHLVVVCDGMGGHAGGREAAELALATIFEVAGRAEPSTPPAEVLRSAIAEANRRVFGMAPLSHEEARPGSTVVAMLLHALGAEIAHVGDSRCYLVHEGQVFQLTKDHSMVQKLVDAQMLSPAEAAAHPDANKILRALGSIETVEVDLRPQPFRYVAGNLFVLCSDGLSDLIENDDILRASSTGSAAQAAAQLVNLANARGGHDNITAVLVRARSTARAQPTKIAATIAEGPAPAALAPPHGSSAPSPARGTAPLAAPVIPPAPAKAAAPARAAANAAPKLPARVALGLALAIVGLAIAAAAVYLLNRERSGHEHGKHPAFDLESLEAGRTPAVDLTPAPPSTSEAADDADGSPLTPLAPPRRSPTPRPRVR